MTAERSALIVAGMYRSGTALAAACLELCGVWMGRWHPEGAAGHDEALALQPGSGGAHEDDELLALQRRLVAAGCAGQVGGRPDLGWAPAERFDYGALEPLRDEARELARRRGEARAPWGWADPRSSLLLPFWQELLPDLHVVLVYRAPWEVERSLLRVEAMADLSPGRALEIWRFYSQALLDFYQAHPQQCSLVPLDLLCQDPARVMRHVFGRAGLAEPPLELLERLPGLYDPAMLPRQPLDAEIYRRLLVNRRSTWSLWERLNELAEAEHPGYASAHRPPELPTLIPPALPAPAEVRLSLIIPCHNDGPYLLESLPSVVSCGDRPIETLLVDDGSDDPTTLRILAEVERQGWRVLRQKKQGLSAARNAAIRAARGEYILPLDADNRLRPGYVDEGIRVLDANPGVGVVYADALLFTESSSEIRPARGFDRLALHIFNYIDACAVFRKLGWQQAGGYDDQLVFGMEDWALWLALSEQGWEFYHLDQVLYEYRVRPDSLRSHSRRPEYRQSVVARLSARHRFYQEHFVDVIAGMHRHFHTAKNAHHEAQAQIELLREELERSQWRGGEEGRRAMRALEEQFLSASSYALSLEEERRKVTSYALSLEEERRKVTSYALSLEEELRAVRAQAWPRSMLRRALTLLRSARVRLRALARRLAGG